MNKLITGNLDQQVSSHPETGGWFLGCFMDKYPDFLSDDVELKWVRHKKGDKKPGLLAATETKTLVILINGKFLIRFTEPNKEITLLKQGDFVFYDASQTSHESEALEDSLLLVVRYPSKRNN
ncbi:MAG: signal peptidase I [Candidatus Kerfeldbacteria bacterium CG_4_10_14_0_8_um_filter_42_10]|uniref:Signal peptidase I n=1 Tax=Candidatus Kerfeldbacteria bacterium CG_4_10_14_0_8_um_filter_42_10 TaxID=2014248 RepID=A0A2M7RKF1_9BACT|nr:MAG: signal peptidase I [Candidatus Kerfeldbacteria bacterium CG_4_10_14_0_8_um_filter_42_10]